MTNFRNKQWFKKLSQDDKNAICNKWHIDEKTLRKCGRENENGEIVIDLLRIDHIEYIPELWKTSYEIVSNNINEIINKLNTTECKIESLKEIYLLFDKNCKYLKYKDTGYNSVLVNQSYKFIKRWAEKINEDNDIIYNQYCSNQIRSILKILLDTDLHIIKKK